MTEPGEEPGAAAHAASAQAAEGAHESSAEGEKPAKKNGKPEKKKDPRPGIPVTSQLVKRSCGACHATNDEGHMSRISYERKTPEGWELTVKRMLRLTDLSLTDTEARDVVRYLANDHGLARAEAEAALWESERRVHWSEEEYDEDMRAACAECHTLGRVVSQRRDKKEWELLKAMHLAFFPLAQRQSFAGSRRGAALDWESMSESEVEAAMESRRNSRGPDRGDRVMSALAKSQGLFTEEWKSWSVNRREVPIAGTWTVIGHEPGRGDIRGEVRIKRVGEDAFETVWELDYAGAPTVVRSGRGLLYAGYSWRGRSNTFAPGEPEMLREVLLLDDDWDHFRGRVFTGEYSELGFDVDLYRQTPRTRIFHAEHGELRIPSADHMVELIGTGFPEDLTTSDFHLGGGVKVHSVERVSDQRVQLRVDVARGATLGPRFVSFREQRGPEAILLYDTIDYIKITPEMGLARVGGQFRPPMLERFEALAMNQGLDGKPYTDDDFAVRVVPVEWSLEEFPVRPGDDDVHFVGQLDASTGVFTPAIDGPNPDRRWQMNNIGDVYVVASCSLDVLKRPEPTEPGEEPEQTALEVEARDFRARGHLLVTVPIYVKWDQVDWETKR